MKLTKRVIAVCLSLIMMTAMFVPMGMTTVSAALDGSGPQGYVSSHLYEGCDLSFYNVNDSEYAYGGASDDSGADYSLLDFNLMKADGCDFVILRIGSEDSSGKYIDPHFYTMYNMAREADLDIGLYYYSYALTYNEAVAEAQFVINAVQEAGMYFEYPLYIDIEEDDQLALSSSALGNVVQGWCDTMEASNFYPGVYGNYSLYEGLPSSILNAYDFWLAYVSSATGVSSYNPSNMNMSDECAMWQYSFYGYGWDGIYLYSSSAGALLLDSNVSYKDYPAIMEQYGYNNISGSGTKTNVSKNATYYADANTRTDAYADTGTKLTDGSKGSTYAGESERYAGWYTDVLNVRVDVGEEATYDTFTVYGAINSSWGITTPPVGLTVYVSDTLDGTYTEVAATTTVNYKSTDSTTGWTTYTMSVTVDGEPLTNQYVKFAIDAPDAGDTAYPGSGHLWLDEVEVTYTGEEGSGGSGGTTSTNITSIVFKTSAKTPVAGGAVFTPTLYSINGDTSLTSAVTVNYNTIYTIDAVGGSSWASFTGSTFEEGDIYDFYFSLTANSGYSMAANCTFTLVTADGSYEGELYTYDASAGKIAFDIYFNLSESASGDSVYITNFNSSITAGAATIFTSAFGTVNNTTANITWTVNCLAEYDSTAGAYIVKSVEAPSESGNSSSYTLSDNQILIAVHWDDTSSSTDSKVNRDTLAAVTKGLALQLNNISIENLTIGTNANIVFYHPKDSIESLGAKANESSSGLRFGATYTKVDTNGELTDLGFLLISSYRLGSNTLDLDYASNSAIASYVIKITACGIEEYEEDKAFDDYDTCTFYATVIGLGDYADQDIVAVPYAAYASGKVVYGEQIVNNLNGVLAGESSFE